MVSAAFIGYASGSLLLGGITYLIKQADTLALFGIGMIIVGTFLNLIWYKETPMYFFKNGKITKMMKVLLEIAKINKVEVNNKILQAEMELDSINLEKYEVEVQLENQSSFWGNFCEGFKKLTTIFSNSKYFFYTVALSLESSALYLIFYGASTTVSDSIGFSSIQINEIVLGISHILGYAIMIPILKKLKRVRFSILFLSIDIVLAVFLAILHLSKLDKLENGDDTTLFRYSKIACAFIINVINSSFFSVYFIHAAELFPTKIRGVGVGFGVLIGKIVGAFSTYAADYANDLGFNVMVICCSPALLALPFVFCLPETSGKKNVE